MIDNGSRMLPLRIGEGGYEVLYGPKDEGEWVIDGFFEPPNPETDATFTIIPRFGADLEDALVIASLYSLKFGSTVVCEWDPPVTVSRPRMEAADALDDEEMLRVAARLDLVQGVGTLSLEDLRLIGQMAKTGLREYEENS